MYVSVVNSLLSIVTLVKSDDDGAQNVNLASCTNNSHGRIGVKKTVSVCKRLANDHSLIPKNCVYNEMKGKKTSNLSLKPKVNTF